MYNDYTIRTPIIFTYHDPISFLYSEHVAKLATPIKGKLVRLANFDAKLPQGWVIANQHVQYVPINKPTGAISVTTDLSVSAYQLTSAQFSLKPGNYQLVLNGKVIKGGICASIVNLGLNKFIAYKCYDFTQFSDDNTKKIVVPFAATGNGNYKIVLNNFSLSGRRSQWLLKNTEINQIG